MKHITRTNTYKFQVKDFLPPEYEIGKRYISPIFYTTNGQGWMLSIEVDKSNNAGCYLWSRNPILEPLREFNFSINTYKATHTFSKAEGLGWPKLLSLDESNIREQTITVKISSANASDQSFDTALYRNRPLVNNEAVSDVSFKVEGKDEVIYGMSGLLTYHSEYFKALLTSSFRESQFDKKKPISLQGLTHSAVLKAFEWIYTGAILSIDSKGASTGLDQAQELVDLYTAADVFLLNDLLDVLPDYFEANVTLSPNNYGLACVFAHKHKCTELLKKAVKFWLCEAKKIKAAGTTPRIESGSADEKATIEKSKEQAEIIREYMATLPDDEYIEMLNFK
ncbi:Radial spoke head 14 [Chytridiales sp. JEL 0842]|nr:Radial spoke head 14 [Chytridiales sp. JEL 0842]